MALVPKKLPSKKKSMRGCGLDEIGLAAMLRCLLLVGK